MKTALYFAEGAAQVVLTPETDFERAVLRALDEKNNEFFIKRGSFYATQGGWTRYQDHGIGGKPEDDSSVMLIIKERE